MAIPFPWNFLSCCMAVVGLCLLSCAGKPDRVKTTEGVVQEPEEFLRSVHLLHGGIAAGGSRALVGVVVVTIWVVGIHGCLNRANDNYSEKCNSHEDWRTDGSRADSFGSRERGPITLRKHCPLTDG